MYIFLGSKHDGQASNVPQSPREMRAAPDIAVYIMAAAAATGAALSRGKESSPKLSLQRLQWQKALTGGPSEALSNACQALGAPSCGTRWKKRCRQYTLVTVPARAPLALVAALSVSVAAGQSSLSNGLGPMPPRCAHGLLCPQSRAIDQYILLSEPEQATGKL